MDDLDQASRALASTSTRDPKAPQASDPRSTSELVSLYLCNPETDEAGQALGIVQYRGGKEEFEIQHSLLRAVLHTSGGSPQIFWLSWAGRRGLT